MTRPNLDTDEGRAAYRAELRRVGWPFRWGGMALNAVATDKRVKAVATSTMYDMSRVMSLGYNDSVTPEQRTQSLEQMSRQRWVDARNGDPAYGPAANELKGGEPQFLVDYHAYYMTPRGYHARAVNSGNA